MRLRSVGSRVVGSNSVRGCSARACVRSVTLATLSRDYDGTESSEGRFLPGVVSSPSWSDRRFIVQIERNGPGVRVARMGAEAPRRRRATATTRFGSGKREGHDASGFYERFAAPALSNDATVHGPVALDRIICADARSMADVPDASVALVVTSPPYFAGKDYEAELGVGGVPSSYVDYLQLLREVFAECVRTLEPGGRIAVNVANLGRRPYRSLSADVTTILQDDLGLLLRGEIVWVKSRGASGSCAWGSFQQATNPVLRDLTERVIVASKGRFDRAMTPKDRRKAALPAESSLTVDEFMESTLDLWEIPPESARRVGHPAPFPVALPERLIGLYTYRDDLVLDPFAGVGSTAVAAVRTGRRFVGYDLDPSYVDAATARVADEHRRLGHSTPHLIDPPPSEPALAALAIAGKSARDLALAAVQQAGFQTVRTKVKLAPELDVAITARDHQYRRWLFDVPGGFTGVRPGLQRAEVVWRTIGKASVARELDPESRFVVLSPGKPTKGGAGAALKAVTGTDRPIHSIIDLTAPDLVHQLTQLAAPERR
jgi:DNA modification methylase